MNSAAPFIPVILFGGFLAPAGMSPSQAATSAITDSIAIEIQAANPPRPLLFAQITAGSTGGQIGKSDKSVSGTEDEKPPSPAKKQIKTVSKSQEKSANRGSCPSIVGAWSSTYSSAFGQGDVTFTGNEIIHRTGMRGTYKCEGGQYAMRWPNGQVEYFIMSADHRKITQSDGTVRFSR